MSEQEKPESGFVFEIALTTSAPAWPTACMGVRGVIGAVQRMLESAAEGQKEKFELAQNELENAASLWQADLFGGPE
jgi:hypothetical protein